jgi:hypothetical protein
MRIGNETLPDKKISHINGPACVFLRAPADGEVLGEDRFRLGPPVFVAEDSMRFEGTKTETCSFFQKCPPALCTRAL